MKRLVMAAALLLACAAHHDPPRAQATRGDPPVVAERTEAPAQSQRADQPEQAPRDSPGQGGHWTPQERENVRSQCQAQIGQQKFCDCLTDKLEVLSPDPKTELTREDIVQGLEACQSTPADSAEVSG
jgi:hypothetical protein